MSLFICRWQNGDFTAASAETREQAFDLFAEIGNAETAEVFIAENFMVHFHLKTEPEDFEEMLPVKFAGFGEQTHRILCQEIYPAYCAAIAEIDKDRPTLEDVKNTEVARRLLDEALRTERNARRTRDRKVDNVA